MRLNLLKKYKKICLLLLLVIIIVIAYVFYESNPANNEIKETSTLFLGSGWNLGNSLDCHPDNLDPKVNSISDYEMHLKNPVTTKAMIDTVKEYGFTTIRIPVTWYNHISKDGKVDEAFMNRVQEVVDYAMDGGKTYVILNTHHENFLEPTEKNEEEGGKKLEKLWRQIGKRFSKYDEHLIFEGMNEPVLSKGVYRWRGSKTEYNIVNKWNQKFVDTIRALPGNNKKRKLIIATYGNTVSENTLSNLEIPNDDNLMVAVHIYLPNEFALNVQGTTKWSRDNVQDCKLIKKYFNNIDKFRKKNRVPFIIDEMGARYKDNDSDRAQWYRYVAEQAYKRDISCDIWDNGNAFQNRGEEFCFLDRNKLSWMHENVLREFLKVNSK